MFTQLRIQNFKAWQDTGPLRLAPLTVFFGTNSSGKTSLFQLLLMLRQTVQSPDLRRALHFGDRHSLVDLGAWPDMVFRREAQRTLGFELAWRRVIANWCLVSGQEEPVEATQSFRAEVGALGDEQSSVGIKMFRHASLPRVGKGASLSMHHTAGGPYELRSDDAPVSAHALSGDRRARLVPARFYGFPNAALTVEEVAGRGLDLQVALEGKLSSVRYLGPLRLAPERSYLWAGMAPEEVGADGRETVGALLAARKRLFTYPRIHGEVGFEAVIAQWLRQMGLLESFEVTPIAPGRREYEVWGRAAGTRDVVNLVDVGFGVSQVLPVLVQLLYVDSHSILLFEEPELHLHPKAQSELADVFIDSLNLREAGAPRGPQLLVASHSEHFLRRIQRRVAEETLKPEQVAVYFCRPGTEGSTIEELQVDTYGRIANWPENFFGDAMGDTEQQMEAMLRRMEEDEAHATQ